MSEPYVNSHDQAFVNAFGRGVERLPDDRTKLVKDIVDRVHEEVVSQVMHYVTEEMAGNAADALREEAAKMTSSMLANALAGDDKEIRNLFGFNEWYMRFSYLGILPKQWALIDAIVARRPDIFLDERLKQRDREITTLNADIARLKAYVHRLEYPEQETE